MNLSSEMIQRLEDAWLGIDINDKDIISPLREMIYEFEDEAHLFLSYLLMQPAYFGIFCKEILNVDATPLQMLMINESWNRKFPMWIATRGGAKTFTEALYCLARCILIPNRQVIVAGSVFRQSKLVFEYMERIYNNSPRLQELLGTYHSKPIAKDTDMWTFRIGQSNTRCIPVGMGDTVRGLRANDLFIEEFAAHNRDIFETVLSGFTAVSADPVEKFKMKAREELAKRMGIELEESKNPFVPENQLLLCGTAYYQFNHFYEYWCKWKNIIETRGDNRLLQQLLGDEIDPALNVDDFMIMRIPVDLIPAGFMDDAQIARSKASMHSGNYNCEFGAVFSADSAGFYKRSLIESCVAKQDNIITNGKPLIFYPALSSQRDCVLAIDPASEIDNLAITILEVYPTHRRIIYLWTIRRKEQKELLRQGLISESDFYKYCCLKIRELMKNFNIRRIALDSQGGGYAILEGLSSITGLEPGELPIYEIIDPDNYKDTDSMQGLHIIEKISFADAKWVAEANHGMRKDFEDKTLLFPYHDPLSYSFAGYSDTASGRAFDTLEDCIFEIEQLKDELSTIVITTTNTGREKWDTPDVKTNNKKGKLRKDRYTALLMGNYSAKQLTLDKKPQFQGTFGGFAVPADSQQTSGPSYVGPMDLVSKLNSLYGSV